MEWVRDLSISILAFVTTIVVILWAVLIYRVYRILYTTLSLVKKTATIARDTVNFVQECIKPFIPIMAMVKGIGLGFQNIFNNNVTRQNSQGENKNE